MTRYLPRIVDAELDELLDVLPAVSIEGARGVGKTETALRRARTVHRLDDPAQRALALSDPTRLLSGPTPILLDEWQRIPDSWDLVRRAVDSDRTPNQFILTGSATPSEQPTHSGAGRIVTVRMRPLALSERGIEVPTVSLAALLGGARAPLSGHTDVSLGDYAREIVSSGLPAIRGLSGRPQRAILDGYLDRVVDHDFPELGRTVRKPQVLRRWMTAYAAATATSATWKTIRDAATGDGAERPAKSTTIPYRDILERLWIVDPLPAWLPTRRLMTRLSRPAKHHLADPALAARLLGLGVDALLSADDGGPVIPRDGPLIGHLFESLVTLGIRSYAQSCESRTLHLRTQEGRREIDLIVERADHRVVAIEVKLGRTVRSEDVKNLLWLRERLGDDVLDMVVVNTGPDAYRRPDGVAVVPAALLGP